MDQHAVLIVSDDAEFSRQVSARWQKERSVPALTTVRSDLAGSLERDAFDLAIVGRIDAGALKSVLRGLEAAAKSTILLSGSTGEEQTAESPRLLRVTDHETWPDTLIVLASEVLRRVDWSHRAERAEQVNALLQCHATLGQYVIDMRHGMNNALTSVLGNAELLLLEPGMFSAGARAQIDTIRNMALRLHEVLQRFSSLEKELTFVEKQAVREPRTSSHAAASGQ